MPQRLSANCLASVSARSVLAGGRVTLMRSDGDPQQQGHFSWHSHQQQILTAGFCEKRWKNQGGPEVLFANPN